MKTLADYLKSGFTSIDESSLNEEVLANFPTISKGIMKIIDAYNAKTAKMGKDFNDACQKLVKSASKQAVSKAIDKWMKTYGYSSEEELPVGGKEFWNLFYFVRNEAYRGTSVFPTDTDDFSIDETSYDDLRDEYHKMAIKIADTIK